MNKSNNKNIEHNLGAFIREYGVPEQPTYDGAAFRVGSKTIYQNHVRKHDIQNQRSAPRIPNEHKSKRSISEIKIKWY